MKLRILIILIVVYVLTAFSWLTYSLLDYSNSDYKLKNDVLKAGLNACILQVMAAAKNGHLGNDTSNNYYLQQLQLEIKPTDLEQFVKTRFNNNYVVDISSEQDMKYIEIRINEKRLNELNLEHQQQRNIWIYQSVLLFLLVGAGVFGVYYSINSLYALNKRQNNFLLSVTHEFKTPIASIRLMLQTALNPKINQDKKKELIDKSIQNTHRLEELSENMLTAMQFENDKYQFNSMVFDLSELMKSIISAHSVKGEITADIEEGINIKGDEFILRIAISNLIENAFKYSDHQKIEVKLQKIKKGVQLLIKDQGIGIQKKEQRKIFKKFYRVQDEEIRTTKGTGLGLFIVKQAVQKHHGTVSVEANQPTGSIFIVKLP